jgi:hypothetical protein
MPIDKSRVDRMISMMDDYLKQLEQDKLNGYPDDDDEEDCNDITNPLEAPPSRPFVDSPPAQIHGEPKKDLFSR